MENKSTGPGTRQNGQGSLRHVTDVRFLAQPPHAETDQKEVPYTFAWDRAFDLVAAADRHLELAGELIELAKHIPPVFQRIPLIPSGQEDAFLSRYSRAELWQSYTIKSPQSGITYTILVEYHDNTDDIMADEHLKEVVFQAYLEEMSRLIARGISDADLNQQAMKRLMYRFGISPRKTSVVLDDIVKRSGVKTQNIGPR